jgi:hypothetical protein
MRTEGYMGGGTIEKTKFKGQIGDLVMQDGGLMEV